MAASVPLFAGAQLLFRIGHNRIYALYMTVYLVISLPKKLYIHRIYMVLANPNNICTHMQCPLLWVALYR